MGAGIGAAVVPFRFGDRGKREVTMFELGCEPGDFVEHHAEQEALPGRKPTQRTIAKRAAAVVRKRLRRERGCPSLSTRSDGQIAAPLLLVGQRAMAMLRHGDRNKYTLPDLPYDYGALEPHISGKIMQLHHDKHHAAYVDGRNEALDGLAEARAKNDFAKIATLEKRARVPRVGARAALAVLAEPGARRRRRADRRARRADQAQTSASSRASGRSSPTPRRRSWGRAGRRSMWDPLSKRLLTAQIHDHQNEITQGGVPILVLDAWEHAYYLQYGPEKASYFEAIWNVWNWADVQRRFEAVRGIDLGLRQAA